MTSKPVVYVSRVTNLSDARYCAGMGADLLGFVIDPEDSDYVSPSNYQDMIGWISGPRRVIQINQFSDWEQALSSYQPELIHVPFSFQAHQEAPVPLIVQCPYLAHAEWLKTGKYQPAYLALTDLPNRETLLALHRDNPFKTPVLLHVNESYDHLAELLMLTGASGVMVTGEKEFQPGLKDYDHLARVFEELDQ